MLPISFQIDNFFFPYIKLWFWEKIDSVEFRANGVMTFFIKLRSHLYISEILAISCSGSVSFFSNSIIIIETACISILVEIRFTFSFMMNSFRFSTLASCISCTTSGYIFCFFFLLFSKFLFVRRQKN